MKRNFKFVIFIWLFLPIVVNAQSGFYQFTDLPLDDLSAFKNPGKNWKIVGEASGNFNESQFESSSGKGVLLNTITEKDEKYQPSQNLFTKFEHEDLVLELDFKMPKGSNSGIYLQGRYEIQLLDSWGVEPPKSSDLGGIYERWDDSQPEGKKGYEGHPPRVNASLAPGIWQHLRIEFQAPRFNEKGKKIENAKFSKVILNGVTVQENIILSGPTRAAAFQDEKPRGPLMIQGDHGSVAFKNIRFTFLEDFAFDLKDVSYEYYESPEFKKMEEVKPAHLVRSGAADGIDMKLADAREQLYLSFSGKFLVKEADQYLFTMLLSGTGKLEIDGKTVIEPNWTRIEEKPLVGSISLIPGEHSFKLHLLKVDNWTTPGLGLIVQKNNSRPKALHVPASLPEILPSPLIEVKALKEPKLLRSFLEHNGTKKTHCISLGDPSGVNLSYDLDQASLLQVWKGPFLNAAEMWYERGEPQIAQPMGASIPLSGACPVSVYTDAAQMLPDSYNTETELLYKGYALDQQRYPTFQYELENTRIKDRFLPYENGKGLLRQISISNAPADKQVAFRLAEGKNIREISKGLYLVETEDAGFYIQLLDKKIKPSIQKKQGGGKALTVPNGSGKKSLNELQYVMLW